VIFFSSSEFNVGMGVGMGRFLLFFGIG